MTEHPAEALEDLLATLDLDRLGTAQVSVRPTTDSPEPALALPETFAEDITLFRGPSQKQAHGRIFGGQVLAQAVIASGRTVEDLPGERRRLHSLHAYFMRPGDDTIPVTFSVERMRDGRSFSTRRVHAIQHGKPILSMNTSFQTPDPGLDHQDPMPQVPDPESLTSLAELAGGSSDPRALTIRKRAFDQRYVDAPVFVGRQAEPGGPLRLWFRTVDRLPDDPLIHDAVIAYASDYTLLEPILRTHGLGWGQRDVTMASLDHAMWFHRPARADEWLLYAQRSPSSQGGRGLGIGQIYTREGSLAVSLAQEGMVRYRGA